NGLVSLLAEALAAGEVTVDLAEKSLRALCGELRAARVSVDDAKEGLLAADDTLRRLAIAGRESRRFRYRSGGNIARDLLIGFARSLPRRAFRAGPFPGASRGVGMCRDPVLRDADARAHPAALARRALAAARRLAADRGDLVDGDSPRVPVHQGSSSSTRSWLIWIPSRAATRLISRRTASAACASRSPTIS